MGLFLDSPSVFWYKNNSNKIYISNTKRSIMITQADSLMIERIVEGIYSLKDMFAKISSEDNDEISKIVSEFNAYVGKFGNSREEITKSLEKFDTETWQEIAEMMMKFGISFSKAAAKKSS